MTTTILPPFPIDGDANFAIDAMAFALAARQLSIEQNAAFADVEVARDTVAAGLVASVWASGVFYGAGTRVWSPITRMLYIRLGAGGTTTTDPSADAANWLQLAYQTFLVVPVAGTTHTAQKGTHVVMKNAAQSELTMPAAPTVGDRFRATWRNARSDNIYRRNGSTLWQRADDVIEDRVGISLEFVCDEPNSWSSIG